MYILECTQQMIERLDCFILYSKTWWWRAMAWSLSAWQRQQKQLTSFMLKCNDVAVFFTSFFYTRTQIWRKKQHIHTLSPSWEWLKVMSCFRNRGKSPWKPTIWEILFCNPSIKQANPSNLPALETKQLASFLKSSDSSDGPNAMDEHGRCGISLLQRGALKPRRSNKTTGIFVLLPL